MPMQDVLQQLSEAVSRHQPVAFTALVETRGSTPQKAGAAMLVFPDGGQFGTLGGGCVEAEVKQRALRVLVSSESQPELLTFHLDDNYGWDDGLICGGRMSILADPLAADRRRRIGDYYRRFYELVESGKGCTEAVNIAEKTVGARYLFDAGGQVVAQV